MDLADKTIANCEEMITAIDERKSEKEHTNLERQSLYIAASLDRCRRCGDHVPAMLPTPPLTLLCGDCEQILKATDGPLWFSDLVAQISSKGEDG